MTTDTGIKDRNKGGDKGTGYQEWNVILWNDDHNSMAGVMQALMTIIGVSAEAAYKLMHTAHEKGNAVVYTGHHEPAEAHREQLEAAGLTATLEQA
mgnify:CR=1 FL=1